MTTLIVWAGIIAILAGTLWMARKAGKDEAQNTANKEALDDVVKATQPATVTELDSVRKRFRRD